MRAIGQLLIGGVLAVSVSLGAGAAPEPAKNLSVRYQNLELFNKVMHFIESNYVDEVEQKKLIDGAIKGMLEVLDPHSAYLPPEIFKDMKVDTSGKFGGLGIEIGVKDNILTVIAPIEETPAWRAGIKSGDRIVRIDGESTRGLSLIEAVAKMRGKKGSAVMLSVYRDGFERVKDIKVVREMIKVQSIKQEEVEAGYGYVKLATFNETAASDIKKAIERLEKNGKLKGLVLDLRANPGGLLDQAVEVSSLFIDEGVIVSTIGRNRDQKEVKYARKGPARKDFNLAVLVNSSSASASEIVAGALQDHHRAIVMGQTTFGKGSVQTVIELGSDTGLKLTIARYFTPSGRSIQEKGVEPDILLEDFDPKLLAEARRKNDYMREKDLRGHMANQENTPASEGKKEDFQPDELEALSSRKAPKKGKAGGVADELDEPIKITPKEDFQVREAVNYLKSFDIYKKINRPGAST